MSLGVAPLNRFDLVPEPAEPKACVEFCWHAFWTKDLCLTWIISESSVRKIRTYGSIARAGENLCSILTLFFCNPTNLTFLPLCSGRSVWYSLNKIEGWDIRFDSCSLWLCFHSLLDEQYPLLVSEKSLTLPNPENGSSGWQKEKCFAYTTIQLIYCSIALPWIDQSTRSHWN